MYPTGRPQESGEPGSQPSLGPYGRFFSLILWSLQGGLRGSRVDMRGFNNFISSIGQIDLPITSRRFTCTNKQTSPNRIGTWPMLIAFKPFQLSPHITILICSTRRTHQRWITHSTLARFTELSEGFRMRLQSHNFRTANSPPHSQDQGSQLQKI